MKRLLVIANSFDAGGAETFLMKLFRRIDRSKYVFDFLVSVPDGKGGEGLYLDEIHSLGGRTFTVPMKLRHPVKCFRAVKRIVRENGYEYVLRLSQQSLAALDLLAAKCGGARVLAMRSTSAGLDGGTLFKLINFLFSPLPRMIPTVKLAPSENAAERTFGRGCVKNGKAHILRNGLDFDDYAYSPGTARRIRDELSLGERPVLGHIGRFSPEKNHRFLLECFSELKKLTPDAALVLVGSGPLFEDTKAIAKQLGIYDDCRFLGQRTDVPELFSAFDAVALPSLYEGMPNVIIEAQAAGLRSLVSDTVTREANITGLVEYLPLEGGAGEWAGAVNEIFRQSSAFGRADTRDRFIASGYGTESVLNEFISLIFG